MGIGSTQARLNGFGYLGLLVCFFLPLVLNGWHCFRSPGVQSGELFWLMASVWKNSGSCGQEGLCTPLSSVTITSIPELWLCSLSFMPFWSSVLTTEIHTTWRCPWNSFRSFGCYSMDCKCYLSCFSCQCFQMQFKVLVAIFEALHVLGLGSLMEPLLTVISSSNLLQKDGHAPDSIVQGMSTGRD